MKLKQSFYSQQDAVTKAARAEDKASRAFIAEQDTRTHQGRKQGSFSAPLKKQSRDAVGGYRGGYMKGK
jgi:hypothetical protein